MSDKTKGPGQGAPHNTSATGDSTVPALSEVLDALRARGHEAWENTLPSGGSMWFTECPNHQFSTPSVRIADAKGRYDWACLYKTASEQCPPKKVLAGLGIQELFPTPDDQAPAEDAVKALLAEMIDGTGLDAIPDPEPLIDGILYLDSIAWLIGKPGHGKSFFGLDFAGHVGTGRPWNGREVKRGNVVYLVAEGVGGIKRRVRAWEKERGRQMRNVKFLPFAIQVENGPEWAAMTEAFRRCEPLLVIVDTQARVTAGLEENSARDMNRFVEKLEKLRTLTGACILVVHHVGRGGDHGRGSSAMDGALTTIIKSSKNKDKIVLSNPKQKDAEEFQDMEFRLKAVPLGTDKKGRPAGSAVLEYMGSGKSGDRDLEDLSENQAKIIGVTRDVFPEVGGTKAEIKTTVKAKTGMADSSFYAAWDRLEKKGALIKKGTKFIFVPLSDRQ